jgi:hypothetical protein
MTHAETDPRAVPPYETEILPHLTPEQAARLRRVETAADWLDTKFTIPVVNFPIGLDGLVGLIPGVGDTATSAVSAWIVYEAWAGGAKKRTLGRMARNAAVDWAIGLIPVVGDVFDIGYKANARNARLLAAEIRAGCRPRR